MFWKVTELDASLFQNAKIITLALFYMAENIYNHEKKTVGVYNLNNSILQGNNEIYKGDTIF